MMGAADAVIVRVQWADSERGGLRTVKVHATSLDEVCHIITSTFQCTSVDAATTALPQDRADHIVVRKATPSRNGARPSRRAVGPPPRQPSATPGTQEIASQSCSPSNGSKGERPAVQTPAVSADAVVGPILWTSEVPEGRFLPAATLLQIQIGGRKVTLRVPGLQHFEVGTHATLADGLQFGEFFEAELVNGAGPPTRFRLTERLL
jgi:hypothetical protein